MKGARGPHEHYARPLTDGGKSLTPSKNTSSRVMRTHAQTTSSASSTPVQRKKARKQLALDHLETRLYDSLSAVLQHQRAHAEATEDLRQEVSVG